MRKNQRWSNSSGILSTYPPKRTLPSSSSTGSNTVSGLKALIQSSSSGSSGNGNSGGTTAGLMSGFMSLKLELREVEGKFLLFIISHSRYVRSLKSTDVFLCCHLH